MVVSPRFELGLNGSKPFVLPLHYETLRDGGSDRA